MAGVIDHHAFRVRNFRFENFRNFLKIEDVMFPDNDQGRALDILQVIYRGFVGENLGVLMYPMPAAIIAHHFIESS